MIKLHDHYCNAIYHEWEDIDVYIVVGVAYPRQGIQLQQCKHCGVLRIKPKEK